MFRGRLLPLAGRSPGGDLVIRMTAAVEFQNVSRHFGAGAGGRRGRPDHRRRLVLRHARALGLGQDDLPAADLGVRETVPAARSASSARMSGAIPPNRRNVNTVFQDYALFPHMNVRDNVAYGLMVKGVDRAARAPARPRRCWRWSSSTATATASRGSCRAGSGSASRWPARW